MADGASEDVDQQCGSAYW